VLLACTVKQPGGPAVPAVLFIQGCLQRAVDHVLYPCVKKVGCPKRPEVYRPGLQPWATLDASPLLVESPRRCAQQRQDTSVP